MGPLPIYPACGRQAGGRQGLVVFFCEITSRGDRHHLRYLDQADIAAVLFESTLLGNILSYADQFIPPTPEMDLLCIIELYGPVHLGIEAPEFVRTRFPVG
jgi:hypothetical protein